MTKKRFIGVAAAAALLCGGAAQAQQARIDAPAQVPGVVGAPGTQSGAPPGKIIKKRHRHSAGVPGVQGAPGTQSGRSVKERISHPAVNAPSGQKK
jgi:hypothetical protein